MQPSKREFLIAERVVKQLLYVWIREHKIAPYTVLDAVADVDTRGLTPSSLLRMPCTEIRVNGTQLRVAESRDAGSVPADIAAVVQRVFAWTVQHNPLLSSLQLDEQLVLHSDSVLQNLCIAA